MELKGDTMALNKSEKCMHFFPHENNIFVFTLSYLHKFIKFLKPFFS